MSPDNCVSVDEFLSRLRVLIGKPVWAALGGGCTGSTIALDVGEKVLRERPCENPALPEAARKYQGELGLLIYCPWRIERGDNQIIGGSGDWDEETESLRTASLDTILAPIENVELNSFLDLTLRFRNDTRVRLFREQSASERSEDDSYIFFVEGEGSYTVAAGRRIEFEPAGGKPGSKADL